MALSKISRRIVAGIAGILLLFCQSTGIAHACKVDTPQAMMDTAHESCHEPTSDIGSNTTQDDTCQPHCGAQQVSTAPAKVSVPAAGDLPMLTSRLDVAAFATSCNARVDYVLARAEPPPLTIVHCRLRN